MVSHMDIRIEMSDRCAKDVLFLCLVTGRQAYCQSPCELGGVLTQEDRKSGKKRKRENSQHPMASSPHTGGFLRSRLSLWDLRVPAPLFLGARCVHACST